MDSGTLLQEGRLPDALAALKDEVRQAPSVVELRVRLFALHSVLGRLDKASSDLQAIVSLDPSWTLPAQLYQSLIRAELLRREVFAGRAKPLVMGEPEPWLAWTIQALAMESAGQPAEARELRERAWESAPEFGCKVDGHPCQWLSDADHRVGPALEAVLEGNYYWIPFGQLEKIQVTTPEFLVEVVWGPAKLTVCGGAELTAQLPARYPGSETCSDGALCLGQKTDWVDAGGGDKKPVGQKLLESEETDFGLLACRLVEFEPRERPASAS
jgi:type VI secretion system protein ImpE